MSKSVIPEPSFNLKLAEVLQRKHPDWPTHLIAENTGVLKGGGGKRPDMVLYVPGGIPVVVETEYMPARGVEKDAGSRLGESLSANGRPIEQAIAVRIPRQLREHRPEAALVAAIGEAVFEFCQFSLVGGDDEREKRILRWPAGTAWIRGGIDDLAACMELTALSENRMAEGLEVLEEGISQAAVRLRETAPQATLDRIAGYLHQQDGVQTSRMAMAIVANAFTFHRAIAGTQSEDGAFAVETIDELRGQDTWLPKGRVLRHWTDIVEKINYWPIFRIANDILAPIPNGAAQDVIETLEAISARLARLGITSQHDLGGRMFQRLIADRKFLATFYTLPNSAALLAELAVDRLGADWADADTLASLKVADFACGTGALLSAAYAGLRARHRRHGGDDSLIHARMMEAALVGADIMPAAAHLTVSMLSSAHPGKPFLNTSIVTLPYGQLTQEMVEETGETHAIGALDLIAAETSQPLFRTGQKRLRGRGRAEHVDLLHGGFDLVIMNPPFTCPTNHEASDVPVPSFAGFATSEEEQRIMSDRLKRIVRQRKSAYRAAVKDDPRLPEIVLAGHGNAGLGSNFMDLAHAKVRSPGGVVALVLSAAFLQGAAWANARRLLKTHYRDITVVSIAAHGKTDRAFSSDTGMAEVLVVATRKADREEACTPVLFVNLLRRPRSMLEAVVTARALRGADRSRKTGPISLGEAERLGCYILDTLDGTGSAGVRSHEPVEAAAGMEEGELRLPRLRELVPLPVCRLGDLGRRGLLHRDINGARDARTGRLRGPFDIEAWRPGDVPTWPTLWRHDAPRERRMVVLPDSLGRPREGCEDWAMDAWQKTSSRLHFNQDFQINSQPLTACLTPDPSIGGRAWPNFQCTDRRWEIPLVLWANTTLGLIAFWWIGTRQQEGRAVLTISKLPALTVLDAGSLTPPQIDMAQTIFREFEGLDLLPANEAWRDDVRQRLDRAVLVDLLMLPEDIMEPLALLRRQWCAEPSVHGGQSTKPPDAERYSVLG